MCEPFTIHNSCRVEGREKQTVRTRLRRVVPGQYVSLSLSLLVALFFLFVFFFVFVLLSFCAWVLFIADRMTSTKDIFLPFLPLPSLLFSNPTSLLFAR
jgi:hypothetical protein